VIGEPLDASKFDGVLAASPRALARRMARRGEAIMTTDTFRRSRPRPSRSARPRSHQRHGQRGPAMIAPDMATHLSFIFTDAPISSAALQSLLKSGVEDTFNAITVGRRHLDSDTLLVFELAPRGRRRAENQPRQRPAAEVLSRLCITCWPICRSRWRGTARRAQASRDHRRGAVSKSPRGNRDVVANSPW